MSEKTKEMIARFWTIGLILVLLIGTMGMASTIQSPSVLPLSFTFIIKVNGLNLYAAYVTGGSALNPQFQESNITKLIHDDIEQGAFCRNGCSVTTNPGNYNVTQTIVIDKANFAMVGSTASLFLPQNIAFSGGPCTNLRPVFCVTAGSFTATGFKVDDIARDFVAGVSGMIFDSLLTNPAPQQTYQSLTIWNASSTAIQFIGASTLIINFCTILGPTPLPVINGNHGIAIGSGASGIRIAFNLIARFNGSDTAGINVVSGVTNATIVGNDVSQNAVGIIINKALAVSITANNIHNNFGPGIVLTTLTNVFRGNAITITANSITNNARTARPDAICNNVVCSGIVLRGTSAGYDTVGITDNVIKDTQAVRTQQFDIDLRSTQYTNLTIQGNTLGLSASGTTIDLTVTPLASWRIESNNGYNPQPKRTITITTNPFTYTDSDAYLEQLQIDTIAGGLATVTCRGNALPTPVIGELSPNLNPGDICVFTGTTTDTFDVLPT